MSPQISYRLCSQTQFFHRPLVPWPSCPLAFPCASRWQVMLLSPGLSHVSTWLDLTQTCPLGSPFYITPSQLPHLPASSVAWSMESPRSHSHLSNIWCPHSPHIPKPVSQAMCKLPLWQGHDGQAKVAVFNEYTPIRLLFPKIHRDPATSSGPLVTLTSQHPKINSWDSRGPSVPSCSTVVT